MGALLERRLSMSVTNGFERHAQTGIQVILVAVTIWVGSSIIALRDATIRMEEKSVQHREALNELKLEIAALRTGAAMNAEKDLYRQEQIKSLESRIDRFERMYRPNTGPGERR